jgi:hypothetical protein
VPTENSKNVARSRKLSNIEIVISPNSKPSTRDDLKRYRYAGWPKSFRKHRTSAHDDEAAKVLEAAARAWLEPATKL